MAHLTDLLRRPHVPRVLLAVFAGRLPEGMVPLGVVLVVREDGGSFALAGVMTAALAIGAAVGGPVLGRLVDRHGQYVVIVASALVRAGAIVALILTGADVPAATAGAVLVAGLATPPLEPSLRALWADLTRDAEQAESAYRLEAGLQQLIFVLGPVLLAGVVAAAGPPLGLQVSAAIGVAGALAYALTPPARRWRSVPRAHAHRTAALRAPGVPPVLVIAVLVGAVIGSVNVAAPAFAEHEDLSAGWLLAAFAAGGLVGGTWAASRVPRRPVEHGLPLLLAGMGLAFAPALLAPPPLAVAALLALGGAFMSPSLGSAFIVTGRRALQGAITETFAWLTTAALVGIAAGSALTGPLASDAGGTRGFVVALAAGLLAAAVWPRRPAAPAQGART